MQWKFIPLWCLYGSPNLGPISSLNHYGWIFIKMNPGNISTFSKLTRKDHVWSGWIIPHNFQFKSLLPRTNSVHRDSSNKSKSFCISDQILSSRQKSLDTLFLNVICRSHGHKRYILQIRTAESGEHKKKRCISLRNHLFAPSYWMAFSTVGSNESERDGGGGNAPFTRYA